MPENLSDYLPSAPLPSFPAKPARRGCGPPGKENLSDYLQSAPLPSFPAKPARRGCGPPGKENHQSLRLKLKSPDLAETSFIMSTIEEEIEGVNTSQNSQEQLISLSHVDSQELIDLGSPSEELLRPVSVAASAAEKNLTDLSGEEEGRGSAADQLGGEEERPQGVAVSLKLASLGPPDQLAREPWTGNPEQGTLNREPWTGNPEQGTLNREL